MTAPRKTAAPKKATSASEWKKKAAGDLVKLPSGFTMRIRRVGLQTLMATGVMPNSLMSIATQATNKGQGYTEPTQEELLELANDPKKLAEIMKFFDDMVCLISVEPKIHKVPADGVERDDELVYTDEVDEEDKMFLFQVLTGGTTDVERFRSEHAQHVDALRGSEDVELPTK